MYPIVSEMASLKTPYSPTPWLVGGHLQTFWGMRWRGRHPDCRRELLTLSDGGTIALDFFDPPDTTPDPPVLMIIHTMCGGTREPCSCSLATAARRAGFRAFVYNSRGCSGVTFTSRYFYSGLKCNDIQAVVRHVRHLYHPKFFFLHGFSLGGYTACLYGVTDGGVTAISAVSHTWSVKVANATLDRFPQKKLYLPIMISKLTHMLRKNGFVNYPKALKAKTIAEYDIEYTLPEENLSNLSEYYDGFAIHDQVAQLKAKTLILTSDNDPMTNVKAQPRQQAQASQRCALVRVPEGGHVAFPTGLGPKGSLIETVLLDYYRTVMKHDR
jgi:predicted alpha/beta-fold hydrolase